MPNQRVTFRRRGMSTKQIDSLVLILMNNKRQQLGSPENALIREVTGPDLRAVLGFNWQLRDIVRFCTNSSKFSVLGADPTFNLGKFHLTVTTYRNLMLVDRKTGRPPMMLGPMLLHQTKTFETYNFFFSKLVGMNKDACSFSPCIRNRWRRSLNPSITQKFLPCPPRKGFFSILKITVKSS